MQEVSGSTPLSSTIEGPAGDRGAFVHFGTPLISAPSRPIWCLADALPMTGGADG
jgi:hypothetical protein